MIFSLRSKAEWMRASVQFSTQRGAVDRECSASPWHEFDLDDYEEKWSSLFSQTPLPSISGWWSWGTNESREMRKVIQLFVLLFVATSLFPVSGCILMRWDVSSLHLLLIFFISLFLVRCRTSFSFAARFAHPFVACGWACIPSLRMGMAGWQEGKPIRRRQASVREGEREHS